MYPRHTTFLLLPRRFCLMALLVVFCLNMFGQADRNIVITVPQEKEIAGSPIVKHYVGYAGMVEYDGEMIPWVVMGDVIIMPPLKFKNERQMKKYFKIANNIKKVYPIAKDIEKTINQCIAHVDSLPTQAEKDAYMKGMEKQLKKLYTPRLKKLTLAQGKLLIKLIDRQCDQTSYQLIKTYMGKFKAGFWNAFATIFGASLKKQYDPEVDDRLTERCIILIESGQL